ncbi:glycosyltransferase family 2 protein [Oxalobacteraceae bacterium R-40]|uniref:Glycosyltransferase family 2 protein n=1 Tax=Keguizhuia sedimenti TaxID=3064264 RepID=A0ABU1BMB7_9BURK|nr:glycosyltransferase family 2 protein [Oxalobacteraceae bacterium R-40]
MQSLKIIVLLSTWNGQRYVKQQINSILRQTVEGGIVELLIRDDGSQDDTVKIIKKIDDKRIRVIKGKNLGVRGSFFALLTEVAASNADYVAFADQDDIWLPGKLQRAVNQLRKANEAALYCSALNLVDDNLHPLGKYRFQDAPAFEGAFLANCATGCTCVINHELLSLLKASPNLNNILMHDWWLYLVASSFGKVIYDEESHIYYRQHANNQVGMRTGVKSLIFRTKQNLQRKPYPSRMTQAKEFLACYGQLLPHKKRIYIEKFLECENSLIARAKFIYVDRPRRSGLLNEGVALIMFVLGRY